MHSVNKVDANIKDRRDSPLCATSVWLRYAETELSSVVGESNEEKYRMEQHKIKQESDEKKSRRFCVLASQTPLRRGAYGHFRRKCGVSHFLSQVG